MVGSREEIDLREATDAGDEGEPDVFIEVLERAEEGAKEFSVAFGYRWMLDIINERLVVLIDEYGHGGFFSERLDQVLQAFLRRRDLKFELHFL